MTSDIASSLRRAIRRVSSRTEESVHFHIDAGGRAFACDHPRCDSAALTLREASLTETGARRAVR